MSPDILQQNIDSARQAAAQLLGLSMGLPEKDLDLEANQINLTEIRQFL